jgi:hypothetical protein
LLLRIFEPVRGIEHLPRAANDAAPALKALPAS